MPRPATAWLTTDTHFFHERMITACGRPKDFTERILRYWRHYLAPQDTLYHLGDVIFYQLPKLREMLESVPGKKILIMGNHDVKTPSWYERHGFSLACQGLLVQDVWLSHHPTEILPSRARLNIHGHWHNLQPSAADPIPSWWKPTTHRLLALEQTAYRPVRLQTFALPTLPAKVIPD